MYLQKNERINCIQYLTHIKKHHPNFEIKSKQDSWFWKLLGWFSPYLMKNYTCVLNTIWIPELVKDFRDSSYMLTILSHEKVHLDQAFYGRFIPFSETPPKRRNSLTAIFMFLIPYLFWYLPVGFAHFRVKKEIEAFARELHVLDGVVISGENDFKEPPLDLTGPEYFWSCSKSKYRQFLEEQQKEMEQK